MNRLIKLNGKYVNTQNIIKVGKNIIPNIDDYSFSDIKYYPIYPIQKEIKRTDKKKYVRLGYTETTLLFVFWMNNYKKIHDEILLNLRNKYTRWLYTTSGYYDKTQHGNYMNVIHKSINDPDVYNQYMSTLLNFLTNADILDIMSHVSQDNKYYNNYLEFEKYLNCISNKHMSREIVYDFIKNSRLLIISPFAPIMKQQIDSGNCKRIYNDFPNVNNVFDYRYPYSFFNEGSDNNILETTENEYKKIIGLYNINDYDNVIISCGAYSNLLAKRFYEIDKNVCTVGGELQHFFGIANKRLKNVGNNNFDWQTYLENYEDLRKSGINTPELALQHWNNFGKKEGRTCKKFDNGQYWILQIPNEYKPKNYMRIEKGCYW
jgi:hypothetical protein